VILPLQLGFPVSTNYATAVGPEVKFFKMSFFIFEFGEITCQTRQVLTKRKSYVCYESFSLFFSGSRWERENEIKKEKNKERGNERKGATENDKLLHTKRAMENKKQREWETKRNSHLKKRETMK
jgi:hypothetical protein